MRFFNTAGPINPVDHYCLPPLLRFNLDEVLSLIAQKKYFVLHAPRQTGKTSCLLALMKYLNETGQYRALYANVESGQSSREDVRMAMQSILAEIGRRARTYLQDPFPLSQVSRVLEDAGPGGALSSLLIDWAETSPLPLVLMLDEIDALVGDTLISVLRQIRSGYDRRPESFPQSIILCGVRDVRDYRIHASSEKDIITGGSAFNIRAESLRLGDFSREDMEQLYAQHSEETGQVFQADALSLAWDLSEGQPWVVNALAYETCFRMKEGRDRSRPITAESMEQAKENLILRRETHLDQLADKLKEDRVRRVIEPLITGETLETDRLEDDIQYVVDLGLIRDDPDGLRISNAIYREVIPRQLTVDFQLAMENILQDFWFIQPDGHLDMVKLLTEFQKFFQENSEHWIRRFEYQEAWPHLLLQAYLQRIVNGGGQIIREYGLGLKRVDLLVVWHPRPVSGLKSEPVSHASPFPGGIQHAKPDMAQRFVLELKVIQDSLDTTIAKGLRQTAEYMDRCAASDGHLILFDRDPQKTWEQKIFRREASEGQKVISVWGM